MEDGAIADPRIAIGGAEDRARRIPEAEAALAGRPAEEEAFRAEADAVALALDPMEDHATDAAYRRDLARTLTLRALEGAAS